MSIAPAVGCRVSAISAGGASISSVASTTGLLPLLQLLQQLVLWVLVQVRDPPLLPQSPVLQLLQLSRFLWRLLSTSGAAVSETSVSDFCCFLNIFVSSFSPIEIIFGYSRRALLCCICWRLNRCGFCLFILGLFGGSFFFRRSAFAVLATKPIKYHSLWGIENSY